jgi:DNA polymerase elongation subunit (family B)
MRGIPTAGWIHIKGARRARNPTTLCEKEYTIGWCDIFPVSDVCNAIASPLIMGFDIEAYSHIPSAMPNSQNDEDCIFQISCTFAHEGEKTYRKYLITAGDVNDEKISEEDKESEFMAVRCATEKELLEKFTDIVNEMNPNVIVGYNIFGFDIPYMIERSNHHKCFAYFSKMGFNRKKCAKVKNIKWSSSAYQDQQFQFLDAEGRLFIDLLPIVRRDYKLDNYRLKTVSTYFLGETKDPLSVKGIFRSFELFMNAKQHEENYKALVKEYDETTCEDQDILDEMFEKTERNFEKLTRLQRRAKNALSVCGKYCVQDSALVVKLMFKLQVWIGLCEMANVCYVQPLTLYTQGQQIKVFSQIYKYCYDNKIVVEHDAYNTKENERYMGAYVFEPIAGLYERVVPFDFNSLYPTTIIAYNIDYSTLVIDENIPDEKCHVMEWNEHNGCEHDPKIIRKKELDDIIDEAQVYIKGLRDLKKREKKKKTELDEEIEREIEKIKPHREERAEISKSRPKIPMCAHRKYRFIREPRGVLPMILKHLLDSRKKTRQQIKEFKEEMKTCDMEHKKELELVVNVLDKRQLSYKISANSAYGAMGVKKGYLPFMPGAMTTTFKGRQNIEIVAKTISEKFKGKVIYGDTDCVVENTPILVKYGDEIKYVFVSELSDGRWSRINSNKELSKPKSYYQIWSDEGWTDIVNVVRCGVKKQIANVHTPIGIVFCSIKHSLLTNENQVVKPSNVKEGDFLKTFNLPIKQDTESYHVSGSDLYNNNLSNAFVLGLFFKYGLCCVSMASSNSWFWWRIQRCGKEPIIECVKILKEQNPNLNFEINTQGGLTALSLIQDEKSCHYGMAYNFVREYVKKFYGENGDIMIPNEILNGSIEMQKNFLKGCCGGKINGNIKIVSLSALGAAGLFYILRNLGYMVSVEEYDKRYNISTCDSNVEGGNMFGVVTKITFGKYDCKYLYDIETENHHFAAGVGELIVHNSNYIHFPHLKEAGETWDYATMVADEVSKMFPPPMRLEFEEVIYWNFFILTKKRYMYNSCQKDGVVSDKVGKKGVLLARRDNSPFVREIYEQVIKKIFKHDDVNDVLYFILNEINKLCSRCFDVKNFVITKAVGDVDSLNATIVHDDDGNIKTKIGKYKVPTLSFNEGERIKQLKKKNAMCESEFYLKSLPAQVQLAQRIRDRGGRVDTGSRLEYVITETGGHDANQSEKIEDVEYFIEHSDILRIDFLYYLKLLATPLDQIIETAFRIKDFTTRQYNLRVTRKKMHEELLNLYRPKIKLIK